MGFNHDDRQGASGEGVSPEDAQLQGQLTGLHVLPCGAVALYQPLYLLQLPTENQEARCQADLSVCGQRRPSSDPRPLPSHGGKLLAAETPQSLTVASLSGREMRSKCVFMPPPPVF